ncbi:hypothetical protein H7C19_18205 [Cohnella nanjingensis]|uniref:Uncharacterized protein n=2 Tax=Cohnella nanjingensis TaxID=1387779 RepID=A0A7X0RS21_9BACL|nr:hypothetical protein [Cohnella nanjingensis]
MLEGLLSVLVAVLIGGAAYYSAHYVVRLRHDYTIAHEELVKAGKYVEELESRVMHLEAERDVNSARMEPTGDTTGWSAMNIRS